MVNSVGNGRSRLSFFQESLWYLREVDQKSGSFNVPRAFRLRGPLQPQVLEIALAWCVGRHEILRSRIEVVDDIPYQVVEERQTREYFETIDLSHLDPYRAETSAISTIESEVARQFMFGIGPLVRVRLIKIAEADHILVVVKPHLVTDASSMRIFIDELARQYTLRLEGQCTARDEAPMQFARYAAVQREDTAGLECADHIDYWRRHLRNAPPPLDLHEGGCRRVRSLVGAERWSDLEPDLVDRLEALADEAGVTLNIVFLSAFAILLSRKSGRDDLIVGTLIANRIQRETAAIIGPLVNTFALRFRLAGDPTVSDFLRSVNALMLGAYRRHRLPYEQVVETLKSEQTLEASFRLQYMFNFFEGEQATPRFGAIAADKIPLDRKRSQADAMLGIHHDARRTRAWCEYDVSLYTERQIERFMQEYEIVLRGMGDDLDRHVSGLPMLNERQSCDVLARWDATGGSAELPTSFSAKASRHPDVAAFTVEGESLTFGALERRSNQFAHRLYELGVASGSTVALPAALSCDCVVAMIGCLKVGCTLLPIAEEWSDEQVSQVISSADPIVVLTGRRAGCTGMNGSQNVVDLVLAVRESASRPSTVPTAFMKTDGIALAPSCSAYSTEIDGLETPYRTGVQSVWSDPAGIVDDRRQANTLACAETIEEVLISLVRGRSVVGVTAKTDAPWLVQAIAGSGANRLILPLRTLIELACPELEHHLGHLEAVFCRAREMPPELACAFSKHLPRTALFHIYTSASGLDLCCRQVHRERDAHVRVDRAMPGMAFRILDRALQLAPVGVLGELYIGGAGVPQDFFASPASTAERFLADPFGPPGSRMHRTGERARRRDDGFLELLGSIEDQIEIDGLLFDAGEVEAILEKDPAIKHAVVVAGSNANGGRHLVAYVVANGDFEPIDTRCRLANLVPTSMVPSAIVPVDVFPRTEVGELDRRALSKRVVVADAREDTPRTPHEVQLARLFAEVLDLEAVGIHASFLELGGHSLLAMVLAARIRKDFDVELPLHLVVEEATIASLAKEISTRQVDAAHLAQRSNNGTSRPGGS